MASFIRASKLVELLNAADVRRNLHVQILDGTLALGVDPLQPSHVIDFSTEGVAPYEAIGPSTISDLPINGVDPPNSSKMARRSGNYWFEFKGRRTNCRSLKELLAEGLQVIEKTRPGTLEKLSHIKPRSKRIVAHDPKELFESERLRKNSEKLRLFDDWWYGTNNSAQETSAWLERACSCAALKWRADFKTSLTH